MEIEDLINRRELASLSFSQEKEVVNYLRKIPENEAFEIILDMIKQKSEISLVAAKKVLNNNKNVRQLLEYKIPNTNAGNIKLWIQLGISKLGARAVIRLVDELSSNNTNLAENAIYWFPMFIPKQETKTWRYFEVFKEKIENRKSQEKKL